MVITFKLIFANHAASYEKALSPSKFPCTLFGVQTPEKGCFLDEIGLFWCKKNSLSRRICDKSFCFSPEKGKIRGEKSSESRQVKSKISTNNLRKSCIYKQIISVVSSINDDNPSIISVVSWIRTDDLEMDAEILEFGWRLLQVYFYGVDKLVLPRFYRTFPLCEGG